MAVGRVTLDGLDSFEKETFNAFFYTQVHVGESPDSLHTVPDKSVNTPLEGPLELNTTPNQNN